MTVSDDRDTPMTTDRDTEIADLIERHATLLGKHPSRRCKCGEPIDGAYGLTVYNHRLHQATVLAAYITDREAGAWARVRGLTVQYETCRGNLERASQRLSNIRAAVDVLRNAVEGPDTSDLSMTVTDDRDGLLSAARHLIATVDKPDDDVPTSPTNHPMAALIEAVKEPPQVVPTNDGNVQLEWHRCGIDIEIGVLSRGTLDGWWDRAARFTPEGETND